MCKYCEGETISFLNVGIDFANGNQGFGVSQIIVWPEAAVETDLWVGGDDIYWENTEINYCPMCGRSLK